MFRLFKKHTAKVMPKTTLTDRVVCRITVYNKALAHHIAEYDIKASERHLIGGIRASYPAHTYRLVVVNY